MTRIGRIITDHPRAIRSIRVIRGLFILAIRGYRKRIQALDPPGG